MAINPDELLAPPGLQGSGIPTTLDIGNGSGIPLTPQQATGFGLDANGKYQMVGSAGAGWWVIGTGPDGRPISQQIVPPAPPRTSTAAPPKQYLPVGAGMVFDTVAGRFLNAASQGTNGSTPYTPYRPTLAINPGQSITDANGQITGHAPLYDPQQFQLLAEEAKRGYTLAMMEAQRRYQADRDVQAYRQATLQAQNDYQNQLLQIQRATLEAQSALKDRELAQPMIHNNADGSTMVLKPSSLVGGAFGGQYGIPGSDWSQLTNAQPMQTPQMPQAGQQPIPEMPAGPAAAPALTPAFQPLPTPGVNTTHGLPPGYTDRTSGGYPGNQPAPQPPAFHAPGSGDGSMLDPGTGDGGWGMHLPPTNGVQQDPSTLFDPNVQLATPSPAAAPPPPAAPQIGGWNDVLPPTGGQPGPGPAALFNPAVDVPTPGQPWGQQSANGSPFPEGAQAPPDNRATLRDPTGTLNVNQAPTNPGRQAPTYGPFPVYGPAGPLGDAIGQSITDSRGTPASSGMPGAAGNAHAHEPGYHYNIFTGSWDKDAEPPGHPWMVFGGGGGDSDDVGSGAGEDWPTGWQQWGEPTGNVLGDVVKYHADGTRRLQRDLQDSNLSNELGQPDLEGLGGDLGQIVNDQANPAGGASAYQLRDSGRRGGYDRKSGGPMGSRPFSFGDASDSAKRAGQSLNSDDQQVRFPRIDEGVDQTPIHGGWEQVNQGEIGPQGPYVNLRPGPGGMITDQGVDWKPIAGGWSSPNQGEINRGGLNASNIPGRGWKSGRDREFDPRRYFGGDEPGPFFSAGADQQAEGVQGGYTGPYVDSGRGSPYEPTDVDATGTFRGSHNDPGSTGRIRSLADSVSMFDEGDPRAMTAMMAWRDQLGALGTGGAGDDLAAIGAGPGLGAPMDTPPGGLQSPIDPSQLVGQGHQFGEPTGDETPYHKGVDFQAYEGTPVGSTVDGTVVEAGERGDLGLSVVVEDGSGQRQEFNHLSSIEVQVGQPVHKGDCLGQVGSTGNSSGAHLDYRVRGQGGDFTDPMSQPAIAGALQGMPDMSQMAGGADMADRWSGPSTAERSWAVGSGGEDDDSYGTDESGWGDNEPEGDSNWDSGGAPEWNPQPEPEPVPAPTTPPPAPPAPTNKPPGYGDSIDPNGQFSGGGWNSGAGGQIQTRTQYLLNQGKLTPEQAYAQASAEYNALKPGQTLHVNGAGPAMGTEGAPGVNLPPAPKPGEVSTGFHVKRDGNVEYYVDDQGHFLGFTRDFDPAQINANRDAQLAIELQRIQANHQDLQAQLDAAYQRALLDANSQRERLQLQLDYNRAKDQLEQQTEFKKLEVAQSMAKEQQASNERIEGTRGRASVLGTWGRAAADSPWLARMSGRTPAPGDLGAGTGYGQQSASSAQLLTGQGSQPSTWQGMMSPGGEGQQWGGSGLGWGGGDDDMNMGQGDANQRDFQIDDPGWSAPDPGTKADAFGAPDDNGGVMDGDAWGFQEDGTQAPVPPPPNGLATPTAAGQQQVPQASAISNGGGFSLEGFGNSLSDLGGQAPTHPTAEQWDQLGPFGHTALRYTLESAGYNWSPYIEAMLADWRATNDRGSSGLTGWSAPMTTPLGYSAYNPYQRENLQQDAELFGPYSDYQERQRRTWQPNTRATVHA